MSVSRQELNAALMDGIETGVHPDSSLAPPRIEGLTRSVLGEQVDLVQQGCADGSDPVRGIGFVVARTLTSKELKIGELNKPVNRQFVLEVARHALLDDYGLEVVTAFGGSESVPTLRAIPYSTPALELAKACDDAGLTQPTVRFVAAHAVSSSLNGLNSETARVRADQILGLTDRLRDVAYPNINITNEHLSLDELRKRGYESDTEHLLEILTSESTADGVAEVRNALEKLVRLSGKHADSTDESQLQRTAAGYAAAHGFAYHNYGYHKDGVIKFGGQGEAPFDTIQQYMASRSVAMGLQVGNLDKDGLPILVNLRTRAGTIPPYYTEGLDELTVVSKGVPGTVDAAIEHYRNAGLRSGSDFSNLPQHVMDQWGDIVR